MSRFGPRSRFLLSGVINTVATYAVYLYLRIHLHYQWAFLIAFVLGIALSYLLNALMVFREPISWQSALLFPFIYLFQYVCSAALLRLLIEILGIDERLAPMLITIAMIPITYALAKLAFTLAARKS